MDFKNYISSLEKHHEEILTNRLEQCVIHTGYCVFAETELLHWYGVAKIKKAIWQDLKKRIQKIQESGIVADDAEYYVHRYNGTFVIVRTDEYVVSLELSE